MQKHYKEPMTLSNKLFLVALALLFFPVTIVLLGIALFLKSVIH